MKDALIKAAALLTVVGSIAGLLFLAGCGVDPTDARRVLKSHGLSNIQIGGHSWFGCGRDDSFASVFTATDAKGAKVTGSICGGWLKGYTVRFD